MSLPGGQNYAMHIVFKNGDTATFASRDRKTKKSRSKDPNIGIERFLKLAQRHEKNAQNIAIYDHREGNPKNGTLLWQWNRGVIKVNRI